jgi:hypothetical protein
MKNIATALVKAQSEMSNPKKGNTNPFFKNKYADLNAIREAVLSTLNENGIVVLQPMVHVDGKNFVKTILLHESGELMESFTEIIYNKINDAQAQGSGITYARRYGLQSFVCVGADDDDGESTMKNEDKIARCKTLEQLSTLYKSLNPNEQKRLSGLATELKEKLTTKTAA